VVKASSFTQGLLTGMFLMIGASTTHWFITPAHFDASRARTIAVAVQAVLAFGVAAILWIRHARAERHAA